MFKTIVVGVDGGGGGADALALAALLQRSFASELVAVHAYLDSYLIGRGANPAYDAVLHDDSNAMLSRELEGAGVEATVAIVADKSPARALHQAAERRTADVIVVGSDRHGPLGRVLPGDVTAGTLHGAPCAVAVAPRGYAETKHRIQAVGVGYDGSPEAEIALDAAIEVAHATHARIELAYVITPVAPIAPWQTPMAAIETERTIREGAEQKVATAVAKISGAAAGHTPSGLAHSELARLSRGVDLLIVGSRGYGPLRRLLLGSTSSKLVREASCPVIALPRGATE